MSSAPAFLTVRHVLAIHERMIAEFGGEGTLRDAALLDSATAMPAAQFAGRFLHDGIPEMGAAYLFHLCRNHPFIDGNKRTALAAADVFLRLNGQALIATDADLEALTVGVASGTRSKEQVVLFFRDAVSPAESGE